MVKLKTPKPTLATKARLAMKRISLTLTLVDFIRESCSFPGEPGQKTGGGGNWKELERGLAAPSTLISLACEAAKLFSLLAKKEGEGDEKSLRLCISKSTSPLVV